MPGRCMLRKLTGCGLVATQNHPHRPLERSGSYPNADRHCCTDLSLVRRLRLVGEARGAGTRTPASRRAGKNRTGRRCSAGQIRMQRRDDFNVATWLPRQHGARPAPAGTADRPDTVQFHPCRKPTADGCGTIALAEGRLPKRVMLYIDPGPWGHVAEWLRNGLQNRVHQFNSGRGLQQ
jgi:hypothetical protein